MEKTCLKCGAVAEVENSPAAECPKCGAIYAKVEAAVAAAEMDAQERRENLERQRRERDERAAAKVREKEEEEARKLEAQESRDRLRMQRAALQAKQAQAAADSGGVEMAPAVRKRSVLESLVWIFAGLCAAYGLVELFYGLKQAESAPQQGAAAAMAAAWAVVPYCLARAIQQFRRG